MGPHKQQGVLAALLLRAGRPVSHDEIRDFVWGDEGPASSVNVIQTYVRRLRDVLEPGRATRERNGRLNTVGPGYYSVRLGEDELDLLRFRALVERAGKASAGEDELRLRLDALDVWRGPCLGAVTGPWQTHPWVRATNQERTLAAIAAVAAARRCHAVDQVIDRLRAVVADEPLNEPLHAQLLLALAESGAEAEAVSVYEGISRRLADEFGVDPSPLLRDSYQEVIGRIVRRHQPVTAIEPVTWRGPHPMLGGLVGRDEDLKRLTELVGDGRVVTITGPGGVGKTSIALAVAHQLGERHPDGVAVAELGPLPAEQAGGRGAEDLEVMAGVLCALLGAPVGSAGAMETLTRAVRDQDMLLVLDNAEHVTASVAALVDRLHSSAARLRILITSRHPVGVPGEAIWELRALPVPPADAADPAGFAAVELYLRRAEQHFPSLDLSDSLPVVAELCRRLDGLPLGIELATGRLRSISPATLLQRIDGWLGVLRRPDGLGLPHQRSLASTVQWSISLLETDEPLLLCRLAVFAGGFDLAAAERVAGFAPLTPDQVTRMLSVLIDHSLVQVDRSEEYRYRLLVPIRDVCRSLAEDLDLDSARDRHLRFYRELSDALLAGDSGEEGAAALARLRAESADVCAALEWGLRPGVTQEAFCDAVGLLTAGRPLWDRLAGLMESLRRWTSLALAHEHRLPPSLWLRLLHWAGRLAYVGARLEESRALLTRALDMIDMRVPADRPRHADIMLGLASISDALLDADAADAARRAIAVAKDLSIPTHVAFTCAGAAVILAWRDHDAEAQESLRQAFAAAGSDQRLLGFCHWYQALVALRGGRLVEADRSAGIVLTLRAEVTHDAVTSALLCLAWGRVLAGALDEADEPLAKAREVGERGQRQLLLEEIAELAAYIDWRRGRRVAAGRHLAAAIPDALTRNNRAVALRMLHLAAALAVEAGAPRAAELVMVVAAIRGSTGYGSWPFTAAECRSWETGLGIDACSPPGKDTADLLAAGAEIALNILRDPRQETGDHGQGTG
ncbi:winged helix-turn-helix domain-containing protein [Streptosporangiaceae bacterium NEAU-GS5]|nr:winged helix-turn-helix domain-containing protein [Streptosporangiaceae bacterium NEAU-GS5]